MAYWYLGYISVRARGKWRGTDIVKEVFDKDDRSVGASDGARRSALEDRLRALHEFMSVDKTER